MNIADGNRLAKESVDKTIADLLAAGVPLASVAAEFCIAAGELCRQDIPDDPAVRRLVIGFLTEVKLPPPPTP